MSETQSKPGRRHFLLGAGAASAAAAAVLVTARKPDASVKTSKASVPPGKGYQLSEHVRNYYRTTTI